MPPWDLGLSTPKPLSPQRTNPIRFGADSPIPERQRVEALLGKGIWQWRPFLLDGSPPRDEGYQQAYLAVVDAVCSKPQPESFARELEALKDSFELYAPEGWQLYETIALQLDLSKLREFRAFAERLKEIGLTPVDELRPRVHEQILLNLALLYTQGNLPPNQQSLLESVLQDKVPRNKVSIDPVAGVDQYLSRPYAAHNAFQELFLKALKVNSQPPLPTGEQVKTIFEPLRKQGSPYYGAPDELAKIATHLLKVSPSLEAYTQGMETYHGFLADESVSPHCKQLAKVVMQRIENPALLPTLFETMRTVESVAGTANLVTECLAQGAAMGETSPEVWQQWFAGIETVMASLASTPERLAQFQALFLSQLARTHSQLLIKDAPPNKPSEPKNDATLPTDRQPFPQWVAQWLPLWERIPTILGANGRSEFTHSLITKTQTAEGRQAHLDALEALFSNPGNAMPQIDGPEARIIMALYCKTLDLNYAQNVKMFLQLRSALKNVRNLSSQQTSTLGQAIISQASMWHNEPMPARLEGLWRALSKHHQQFLAQGETDGFYIYTLVKFVPSLLKVSASQNIGPTLAALVEMAHEISTTLSSEQVIQFLNVIENFVERRGYSVEGLTGFVQSVTQDLQGLTDPSEKLLRSKQWWAFFSSGLKEIPSTLWPTATTLFQQHASLFPLGDSAARTPILKHPQNNLFCTLFNRKDEGAALAPLSDTLHFLVTQWSDEQLPQVLSLQTALIEKSPDLQTLQEATHCLKALTGEFSSKEALLETWDRVWDFPFWPEISPKHKTRLQQATRELLQAKAGEVEPIKLLKFLQFFINRGYAQGTPDSLFEKLVTVSFAPEVPPTYRGHRNRFEEMESILSVTEQQFGDHSAFVEAAWDVMLTMSGSYRERYGILHYGKPILSALQQAEPDWDLASPETLSAMADQLRVNLKALANITESPSTFLNYILTHRDTLNIETYKALYYFTEYGNEPLAQALLPELLALLEPTFQRFKAPEVNKVNREALLHQASAGLTRLYRYIYADNTGVTISRLERPVLENWARIGTLGLSFTKWQMDAMAMWKGQGPKQEDSLLEQSGMFQPIPERSSDGKFFRGFIHHNPDTGVSIELRRAYITIAKPGVGTLVIRNSSPVFGRDLLREPAYFHPSQAATGPQPSFDPETDLTGIENILVSRGRDTFLSVMGKVLTSHPSSEEYHQRIRTLLDAFDAEMEPYISWKCGFKNGEAPPGLAKMLESALASVQEGGSLSPFGKLKNVRLAWVDRYGLPFSTQTFDLTDPAHQQEAVFFLNVLKRRQRAANTDAYAQKMPNLLAFLKEGLKHNLELVLTPASPPPEAGQ